MRIPTGKTVRGGGGFLAKGPFPDPRGAELPLPHNLDGVLVYCEAAEHLSEYGARAEQSRKKHVIGSLKHRINFCLDRELFGATFFTGSDRQVFCCLQPWRCKQTDIKQ
jgi:hypothetical protein